MPAGWQQAPHKRRPLQLHGFQLWSGSQLSMHGCELHPVGPLQTMRVGNAAAGARDGGRVLLPGTATACRQPKGFGRIELRPGHHPISKG